MNAKFKRLLKKNSCLDKAYEEKVRILIRDKYDQDAVEAILNNYISDPSNEKYVEEFTTLQEYRAQCKAAAKAEVYTD